MSLRLDVKELLAKLGYLCAAVRDHGALISVMDDSVDLLRKDVTQALRDQPLNVKLTQKQVDQVIQRFNDPLVLPREITEHIASDLARNGNVFYQHTLGYGRNPFCAEYEFRTDGTVKLVFSDCTGHRFWTGVFHGVDG